MLAKLFSPISHENFEFLRSITSKRSLIMLLYYILAWIMVNIEWNTLEIDINNSYIIYRDKYKFVI